MLPGYVAGMYTREECHIDLPRLATFANARLVHAEACGIDVAQRRVLLKVRVRVSLRLRLRVTVRLGLGLGLTNPNPNPNPNQGRPPVAYDVLSIDIGSAPLPVPSQPGQG